MRVNRGLVLGSIGISLGVGALMLLVSEAAAHPSDGAVSVLLRSAVDFGVDASLHTKPLDVRVVEEVARDVTATTSAQPHPTLTLQPTPTPTTDPTPTPTVSRTPTPTPSDLPTPTPSGIISPTPIASGPTPIPTPTLPAAPSPTPKPVPSVEPSALPTPASGKHSAKRTSPATPSSGD